MSLRLVLAAVAATLVSSQSCDNALTTDYDAPVVAGGWEYSVVANGFEKPRGILVDSEGALLLVDSSVGIIHIRLADNGGVCVSADETTTLVESTELNHGLVLSSDGRTLYASSSDKVFSWSYDAESVTVDDIPRTLVSNMSNTDHTTRTLLLSQNVPGYLIVSRGSQSNEDPEAEDITSGHSQIRAFNLESLGENDEYDFANDGVLLGWGLRNSVGVAEEPLTGGIWSVENSVDDLTRNGIDIHQDNPGEELNFHGFLNNTSDRPNYGYPLCYALWDTEDFPDIGTLDTGDQFSTAETSTLDDGVCSSQYRAPRLTFQAHTAPLDIKFTDDGDRAYITFHGSWNRDEPVGYKLSAVEFSEGYPVEPSDSMSAAVDILTNPDMSNCPDNCFRPVGLAWGQNGRLFMTSDTTGEVFVLRRTGEDEEPIPSPDPTGNGAQDEDDNGDNDGAEESDEDEDNAATRPSATLSSALWLTGAAMGFSVLIGAGLTN